MIDVFGVSFEFENLMKISLYFLLSIFVPKGTKRSKTAKINESHRKFESKKLTNQILKPHVNNAPK